MQYCVIDQTFVVTGKLPDMNSIIADSKVLSRRAKVRSGKSNRYSRYNETKKRCQSHVVSAIKRANLFKPAPPVHLHFVYTVENKRKDLDNIDAGARKIIIDALVSAGVLDNDNPNHVARLSCEFIVGDSSEVHVDIMPLKQLKQGEFGYGYTQPK